MDNETGVVPADGPGLNPLPLGVWVRESRRKPTDPVHIGYAGEFVGGGAKVRLLVTPVVRVETGESCTWLIASQPLTGV